MSAKKGQKFIRYSDELKLETVRLILEENWSQYQVQAKFGIRSRTQIMDWAKKYKTGKLQEEHRGKWRKKHFNSLEEENAHLKAQVEYLKKAQSQSTWGGKLDKQKRFGIIAEMVTRYSVTLLCQIAEVSRSGYYKWKAGIACRAKSKDRDATLQEHILAIHRLRPYYGYIRMRTALQREGIHVNQKTTAYA